MISTITKTNFGQVNFTTTIENVVFKCLGCGKHASRCSITNGKQRRFTKVDLINLISICMKIKNDMGCQKLGLKVH
jgi:hypothetical protein